MRRPLAVGALAVLVAACGSDDGATAPTVTFASPGTTATTDATTSTAAPGTTAADATTAAPASTLPATEPPAPTTTESLGVPVVALQEVASAASPVDLAWRTGDPTLFVVEQRGSIRPLRDGALGDPVLDISDLTDRNGEQGLLGLTFAHDGSLAYVNYTNNDGDTVIAEYPVGDDGTFAAGAARVLMTIDQPYANHNGGNVAIGPDGMLWIGMGDGGSGGDPERHSLNVSSLLGKMLRIDPTPSGDQPYTIPTDNPFVGVEGARGEIWSVGLRNPWRFGFDRRTGDLWIGDVGQGEWEEIDIAWADEGSGRGLNFGWSAFEGTHRYNEDQPADGAIPPVYEYEHGDAGCSVSGGAVYRGSAIPALVGWYVFSDYCSGIVSGLRMDGRTLAEVQVLAAGEVVSAVREGPDGELFVLSLTGPISLVVPG